MANTVRDEESERRATARPVLVHVLTGDDLLRPPLGVLDLPAQSVVGRKGASGANDLGLEDPRASERHLEVTREGAVVAVRDLGSSNGTLLNGRPLTTQTRLRDGDLLELGRSLLVFRDQVDVEPMAPTGGGWCGGRTFSARLAALNEQLLRIARSGEPVLLLGETGVGKDVVARFVHAQSQRSGAMVAVDCGALPETLFESALFGHVKGAFTGATEARAGDIEQAHQGTLFLDEVGNLPLPLQAKLLRVLETKQVRRLGQKDALQVDVRFVAATNAALDDDGSFRSDLRFRLAGFVARIPPLRARREDLGLLMATFLREAGLQRASLSRAAAARLLYHEWPGNLRQLRAALRTAVFLAGSPKELTLEPSMFDELDGPEGPFVAAPVSGPALVAADPELEPSRRAAPPKEALEAALRSAAGRVTAAARALNTSPRQLYRWLERWDLDPDAYRG
jgi:DNA-binding NtrC family response regulator